MAPRPALERLRLRPAPEQWDEDELVTMREAASLFFPSGPFDAASLRVACRRGELACVEACGRLYTTPRALRTLRSPTVRVERPVEGGRPRPTPTDHLAELRLALGS